MNYIILPAIYSNSIVCTILFQIKALQHYDLDEQGKQGYEGNDRRGENGCNNVGHKNKHKVQLLEWNNSDDEYFSEGEFSAVDFDDAAHQNSVSLFIMNRSLLFLIFLISYLF